MGSCNAVMWSEHVWDAMAVDFDPFGVSLAWCYAHPNEPVVNGKFCIVVVFQSVLVFLL